MKQRQSKILDLGFLCCLLAVADVGTASGAEPATAATTAALVNDMPRSVMLDTGASRYLLGTKAALDEVTVLHRGKLAMDDIGGRHAFANAQSAKVRLTIAGQPIDVYFAVYTDSGSPHAITLGAGALRDMDFLLDFRHQHMCLLLHPDLH